MADTLLHLNNSQSQTILWLLEELGVPYNIKPLARVRSGMRQGRAPENLRETHPLGKSPQLITPEGRVLVERSAITMYLVNRYDEGRQFQIHPDQQDPTNDELREQMLIGFADASFSSIVIMTMMLHWTAKLSPFFVRPMAAGIESVLTKGYLGEEMVIHFKYINNELEARNYFMGQQNPTRVDFIMLWYVHLVTKTGVVDLAPYLNLRNWVARCEDRPAWKRALEKGNEYVMRI
ncbi:glutathione S-transferase [Pseudomassariella vexata]|uniref:Glutathione S-transferase n=1 Tax=Pseudomassariella vexata TaxID=1141098 RepID=A0A1Y2DLP5_9PEZI|nr:glutathione S-transferase [Pseudomassariella vexata]ORY60228.1 glutathione S-transferase [Pseudomassariella vexata]